MRVIKDCLVRLIVMIVRVFSCDSKVEDLKVMKGDVKVRRSSLEILEKKILSSLIM